jgi:glycogen synthase
LESLKAQAVASSAADRIEFLGKVSHESMALYMRAADYLALYSGYEGLSHTILEALYAGTPVIASARGGNPEIVRNDENGLLVKHPDRDALITAMRCAFEGDTPSRLASGTKVGLDRFAWSGLVEHTVKVLVDTAQAKKVAKR